jgi:hypothetical protein
MKTKIKHFFKTFFYQIGVFLLVASMSSLVLAAWNSRVNSNDTLTTSKWNDLVAKVEQIENTANTAKSLAQNSDDVVIQTGFNTTSGNTDFKKNISLSNSFDYYKTTYFMVSAADHNDNSYHNNTEDASFCYYDKINNKSFDVYCGASTSSSSSFVSSKFQWMAIQIK